MNLRILSCLIGLLLGMGITLPTYAQVVIPDPGLNAVIRATLGKPIGPLTQQDMLSLTNLNATNRNIRSIEGLETARNLSVLHLNNNALTNFALPNTLTNLGALDLSSNPLSQCTIPGGLTNLGTLTIESCQLNSFTLPANLTGLTTLDLMNNHLTTFTLPAGLLNLTLLNLGFNSLTQCSIPASMTNLETLFLQQNSFNSFTLPAGLTGLSVFHLWANHLTSFTLPADTTNLTVLLLNGNQLTNVTLPGTLRRLTFLDLDFNQFRNFTLPAGMSQLSAFEMIGNPLLTNITLSLDLTNLTFLDLEANQLRNFTLPAGMSRLSSLRLGGNQLTSFILPAGLTNLHDFAIAVNQLTNLVLPSDLFNVGSLDLGENSYSNFIFPRGLTNLVSVDIALCQLTNLTLAPDMTQLTTLFVLGNPFVTFVISEPMAVTNLAPVVAELRNQGVSVFTYPLDIQLVRTLELAGAFKFAITGPPGVYTVLGSTNLADWSAVGEVNNPHGGVNFHDATENALRRRFYRALLQTAPTNMVFIPPNTFTMGSPNDETGREADEGPQTEVTLTRGFWIGKFEVTQGEYLAVTGENQSDFPGNLNRPVEIVSFLAASNYCVLLTAREQASGRIPPGSRYRLPTEAEWECAARAGTATRFSHGDDPDLTELSNFAWFGTNSGNTTHPVGQKLPNAWGLYDMEGNVWEWCQDWYGPYPGGSVIDPQGVTDPREHTSNPFGFKVIRGGAWEASGFDCRSASRWAEVAYPFVHDFRIGFRVVLVTEPQ